MDFSVILCAYNPDVARLERVVKALAGQDYAGTMELIVVDNNSSEPLRGHSFMRDVVCVEEKKQGLAWARVAGFVRAKGHTIVFVDDDNILAADYLSRLREVLAQHPQAGVAGPGAIDLEYEGKPPQWLIKHFGNLFQERSLKSARFGKEKGWPAYYPAGSGLCVRRSVMEAYVRAFTSGLLTASGRKGNTLSSGEDAQIVWTAITMGMEAGTTPALRLTHIIPESRQSLSYLIRLQYNLGLSYCLAMAEIFPENKSELRPLSVPGHARLLIKEMLACGCRPMLFYRKYRVALSWFRGVKDAAANR